jgi:biotin carboxyl carrier protein
MSSYAVTAELVGSVGEVVAHVGDLLEPTDTVVVLESMKMEIPVLAEVHGTVREVSVVAGDVISEGDIIAVLDTAVR